MPGREIIVIRGGHSHDTSFGLPTSLLLAPGPLFSSSPRQHLLSQLWQHFQEHDPRGWYYLVKYIEISQTPLIQISGPETFNTTLSRTWHWMNACGPSPFIFISVSTDLKIIATKFCTFKIWFILMFFVLQSWQEEMIRNWYRVLQKLPPEMSPADEESFHNAGYQNYLPLA